MARGVSKIGGMLSSLVTLRIFLKYRFVTRRVDNRLPNSVWERVGGEVPPFLQTNLQHFLGECP